MPTYEKAPESVHAMVKSILAEFDTHKPLIDQGIEIDLIFAFPFKDDDGFPLEPSIKWRGREAHGVARLIGIKDRVMGRGDCEILIDGHWWESATEAQRRALLDHELHHFEVKRDRNNHVVSDALGRPVLRLRKHDIEFGWFSVIAARHGAASQERIQAKSMMDGYGQLLWPTIVNVEFNKAA